MAPGGNAREVPCDNSEMIRIINYYGRFAINNNYIWRLLRNMHQPGYTTFGAESYLSWECHRRAREVPNDVPGGPDDIGTTRFGLSVRENPRTRYFSRPGRSEVDGRSVGQTVSYFDSPEVGHGFSLRRRL